MDTNTVYLVALAAVVLVVIGFFALLRGRGRVHVKTPFGSVSAEGQNPSPPAAVPAGVKVSGEAGGDVRAHSTGSGGVEASVKAGGNIEATHEPGPPPPKA